jgi:large subunit ribosomal protein L6
MRMSRIGRIPVAVPDAVKVTVADGVVKAEGPKGKLAQTLPSGISAEYVVKDKDRQVVVRRSGDAKRDRALHGLMRSLIQNMVRGCAEGYSKQLEVYGVGYSVKVEGGNVVLQVGFANAVSVPIPTNIKVTVELPTNPGKFTISGPDKQQVGLLAAQVRKVRPPEPYQGKGIRYADEVVRRKAGKSFTSGGA